MTTAVFPASSTTVLEPKSRCVELIKTNKGGGRMTIWREFRQQSRNEKKKKKEKKGKMPSINGATRVASRRSCSYCVGKSKHSFNQQAVTAPGNY